MARIDGRNHIIEQRDAVALDIAPQIKTRAPTTHHRSLPDTMNSVGAESRTRAAVELQKKPIAVIGAAEKQLRTAGEEQPLGVVGAWAGVGPIGTRFEGFEQGRDIGSTRSWARD
jgi:hypothetical protein